MCERCTSTGHNPHETDHHHDEVDSHAIHIQFRTTVNDEEGVRNVFTSIPLLTTESSFRGMEVSDTYDLLNRYYNTKGNDTPTTEEELRHAFVQELAPDTRSKGKGFYSKLDSQLIQAIFDSSISIDIHQFPKQMWSGEARMLVLAALMDTSSESHAKKIFQQYVKQVLGKDEPIEISIEQATETIIEHEAVQQRAIKSLESKPKEEQAHLDTDKRFMRLLNNLITVAQYDEGILPDTLTTYARATKILGLRSFTFEHIPIEKVDVLRNEQNTQLFSQVLANLREQHPDIDHQSMVILLSTFHDRILSRAYITEGTHIVDKALGLENFYTLQHEEISLLLALGMEIQTRPNKAYTEQEKLILDVVMRLNSQNIYFLNYKPWVSEFHDPDSIHGALRVIVGPDGKERIEEDPCSVHTPLQDEMLEVQMQDMVKNVLNLHEQNNLNKENVEQPVQEGFEQQQVVGGEVRRVEKETGAVVGAIINSFTTGSALTKRDGGVVLPFKFSISTSKEKPQKKVMTTESIPLSRIPTFLPVSPSVQELLDRGVIPVRSLPLVLAPRSIETDQVPKVERTERDVIAFPVSTLLRGERSVVSLDQALQVMDANNQKPESISDSLVTSTKPRVLETSPTSAPVIPELLASSIPNTNGSDGGEGLAMEVPKLQSQLVVGGEGGGLAREFRIENSELRIKTFGTRVVEKRNQEVVKKLDKAAVVSNIREEAFFEEKFVEEGTHERITTRDDQPVQKKITSKKSVSLRLIKDEKQPEKQFKNAPIQPTKNLRASKVVSSFDPSAFQYAGRNVFRQLAA